MQVNTPSPTPMPALSPQLQKHLDRICTEGCHYVRNCIGQLENGEVPGHATELSAAERILLLAELKAIMAVYDAPRQDERDGCGAKAGENRPRGKNGTLP